MAYQVGRINGPALADNLQREGTDTFVFETDLLVIDGTNGTVTTSGALGSSASTTSRAGINIPEGVAPTIPADGDVWVTAAGEFFARLNGVSIDLNTTGNATHTGQVTGATALALDVTAITAQPASGVVIGTDTLIINDGGVLSEVTITQLDTFFSGGGGGGDVFKVAVPANNEIGVWTGDGTIEGDTNFTWTGAIFNVGGSITLTGTVDGIDIATDVAANTLKVTNATHTGQVTGATALALDITAVTAQPASGAIIAADTIITNDGGILSEATFTQMDTYFDSSLSFGNVFKVAVPANNEIGIWTGDGTIEGDTNFTWTGAVFNVGGNITLTGTVDGIDIATDVAANTAKVTNATHTGQVTGATALALGVTAITAQPASGAIIAADTIITNDGGVLSEATFTQMDTYFNSSLGFGNVSKVATPANNEIGVWTGDGTIEGDTNFTWDGAILTALAVSISGDLSLTGYTETINSYTVTTGAKGLDMTAGTYFYPTGAMTAVSVNFTFDNPAASGSLTSFMIEMNNMTVNTNATPWPAGVDWPGGTEPTWTAGIDVASFWTRDGGTTWHGTSVTLDSK